jgi:hypothetical protein
MGAIHQGLVNKATTGKASSRRFVEMPGSLTQTFGAFFINIKHLLMA